MPAPTQLLPIATLSPGKNIRGTDFEVDDLIQSFQHVPQLHAVLVRRRQGNGPPFEVLAGHRRLEAARRLGWTHVEAKVVDVDDLQAEVMALEENLRRRAVPDEAAAIARLLAIYKVKTPERRGGDRRSKAFFQNGPAGHFGPGATAHVAGILGTSERDVRRKARVGACGTLELREALATRRVTIHEAERLAALPPKVQRLRVATLAENNGPRRDIRRALEALLFAERVLGRQAPSAVGPGDIRALSERLAGLSKAIVALETRPRSRPSQSDSAAVAIGQKHHRDACLKIPRFEAKATVALPNGMTFGRIPMDIGKTFIERYEWLGHAGRALIFYGAWRDRAEGCSLYGVEAFCPLPLGCRKQLPPKLFEKSLYLARGACSPAAGPNAASMLIGAALRDLRSRGYQLVLAFADPRAGERGGCYRAANAEYGGMTTAGARYYLFGGQWMTGSSVWRLFGLTASSLPKRTRREVDRGKKLRFFWVLDEHARPDLPEAWLGLKFEKSWTMDPA